MPISEDMKALAVLAALALPALPLSAQETVASEHPVELSVVERWRADPTLVFEASEVTLSDLLFVARPVIVFADSPFDPRFAEQVEMLAARAEDLAARDVIVIVDSDLDSGSDARERLRPRGFGLVVIGKDGRVAQRKPAPFSVREIGRAIDKLPLRQQELRDGR